MRTLEALSGDSYPGEHSRKVGLTVACLLDEDEGELTQLTCLTKGIVYELSLLRRRIIIFYGVNSMIGLRNYVVDQLQQRLAHSK